MGKILMDILNKKADELGVKIIERFSQNKRTMLKIVSILHPEKGERIVEQYNFLHHTTKCWYFNKNSTKEDLLKHYTISSKIDIIGNYVNNSVKILCRCKICGNEWHVSPNKLLSGRGCPECAKLRMHACLKKSNEDFLNEMSQTNPSLIILDEYYNCRTKISYKCSLCGRISTSTPQKLLNGESGCHFCKSSIGEQLVFYYLNKYNIYFEREKYFPDCKYKKALPFDFYLKDYNICIEFQGEQHYRPVDFSYNPTTKSKIKAQDNFLELQKRDKIKDIYCKEHDIHLIIIPYTQIKQIESILIKELKLSTVTTAGSL